MRDAPIKGASTNHQGIDISVPEGTPVYSVMAGSVFATGYQNTGGNYVIIKHSDGSKSSYAHLSQILASKGQSVSKGQKIALSGNTGNSTGAHLHFKYIDPSGKVQDPCKSIFTCDSVAKSCLVGQ